MSWQPRESLRNSDAVITNYNLRNFPEKFGAIEISYETNTA